MGMSALYSAYGYASSGLSYLNEKTGAVEKATSGLNNVCSSMSFAEKAKNVAIGCLNSYKIYNYKEKDYLDMAEGLANGAYVVTQLGEAYAVIAKDPQMRKNLNVASGVSQLASTIAHQIRKNGTIDQNAFWEILRAAAFRSVDFLDVVAKREGMSYTTIGYVVYYAIALPRILRA